MFTYNNPLATANRENAESMFTLANAVFNSVERVVALNFNTAREALESSVSDTKTLLGAKDVQELSSLQASLVAPALEKAVGYSRNLYEIVSQTQVTIGTIIEQQCVEGKKEFDEMLDKAAKNGPAGSNEAVKAIKTAVAAGNDALDTMSQASKKFAEMAEHNVAALSLIHI